MRRHHNVYDILPLISEVGWCFIWLERKTDSCRLCVDKKAKKNALERYATCFDVVGNLVI